jgi:hypothetical protein
MARRSGSSSLEMMVQIYSGRDRCKHKAEGCPSVSDGQAGSIRSLEHSGPCKDKGIP